MAELRAGRRTIIPGCRLRTIDGAGGALADGGLATQDFMLAPMQHRRELQGQRRNLVKTIGHVARRWIGFDRMI